MNNKHKELLCLSCSYLDMFLSDNKGDSNIKELFEFIRKEVYFTVANKDMQKAIQYTKQVCDKIEDILNGTEMQGNVLTLAIASAMVIRDDAVYKMSKGMQLNRLVNSIYGDLEKANQGTQEFNNSMKLVCSLVDYK